MRRPILRSRFHPLFLPQAALDPPSLRRLISMRESTGGTLHEESATHAQRIERSRCGRASTHGSPRMTLALRLEPHVVSRQHRRKQSALELVTSCIAHNTSAVPH